MLPTDAKARKAIPVYSGFIKYFPRAIAAIAELSRIGNDQHNPGKPLHWDRSKSGDELDALIRHLLDDAQGVPVDSDGVLHATKVAWRAMAHLEKQLEAAEDAKWPAGHDGWAPHVPGNRCPCAADTLVDVRLRNGELLPGCSANTWWWGASDNSKFDYNNEIIA